MTYHLTMLGREIGVPVVREQWLLDSIERQEPQPFAAYDMLSNLAVEGRRIESLTAEVNKTSYTLCELGFKIFNPSLQVKLYGKRAVYKDTRLHERGGGIFERDGIVYNCAFSQCNLGQEVNE